jgi:hypothetical protein
MSVTHTFVSAKSDGGDATLVRPSNWNAAHTLAGTLAWDGATITVDTPLLDLSQTWNASGVTFTAFRINVTNTASAAASKLIDLQIAAASLFSVDKTGIVRGPGGIGLDIGVASANDFYIGIPAAGPKRAGLLSGDSTWALGAQYSFAWSNDNTDASAAHDLFLSRDAADILAQRRTTNPQTFRLYNTYTDSSNYERGVFDWTSNTLTVGAQAAGTGTLRAVKLVGNDITVKGDTATPAGGSTAARLLFGTTAGFGIYYGSGAPTVSAAAGSLYIRTDNAGANLRLYSNTTGSTTWAAITSA